MATNLDSYLSSAAASGQKVGSATGGSSASSRISSGAMGLADNFETFLTLLTAQLKNQDPLSPMDGNQFTAQLVQMSGVEQQLLTNDLLESLVAKAGGGSGFGDPVDMIGKVVVAEADKTTLGAGGASWAYEIPKTAAQTTLEVRDGGGRVVWTGQPPQLTSGRNLFVWDGKTSDGGQAPDGVYSLAVKSLDASGKAMLGKTFVERPVTGVELTATGPLLWMGKVSVALDKVSAVRAAT